MRNLIAQSVMRLVLLTIAAWSALAFVPEFAPAFAHESRPFLITVNLRDDRVAELQLMPPPTVEAANSPIVILAPPCNALTQIEASLRSVQLFECPDGIVGARMTIAWGLFNPSITTMIQVRYANGEVKSAVLSPSESDWTIPAEDTFTSVSRDFFMVGAQHIFAGADHLLFLAGLVFIAGGWRRILVTVSGFTLAHSITLALVALDIIHVSAPATEAVIALSIVFLAAEIARNDRSTIAWRHPAIVAIAFGFIHGAGFAAALGEIGLPPTEKAAALFFFNVGVEAGQILIVASGLATFAALRMIGPAAKFIVAQGRRLEMTASYAIGSIAAFWFVERMAGVFGPA